MSDPSTAPAAAPAGSVRFFDRRPEFRRLAFRGALLEFVTLGFYRFWLANDIRRHLWSHSSVEGDAAEYTGTAKELLLGFLFALAILVPIYLVYFWIGLEAERWKEFASAPLALFFYVFYQFAIYRARRYRLNRTVWRGVRFGMGGSGLNYAWRVALWSLWTAITLGLALPWRQAALERFKMRHSYYGNLAGRFDGTGGQLFKRGWWLWLASLVIVIAPIPAAVSESRVLIGLSILAVVVAWPFIYAAYKAIEWRWWASGLRFGEVAVESCLSRGALIDLYWKMIGWTALLLLLLGAWFGAVGGIAFAMSGLNAAPGAKIVLSLQQIPVLIAFGVGYLVAILASWMIVRIYLIHDLWQRVAESVIIHNLVAAQDVAAQGSQVSALGEGFANSLDIAGF